MSTEAALCDGPEEMSGPAEITPPRKVRAAGTAERGQDNIIISEAKHPLVARHIEAELR